MPTLSRSPFAAMTARSSAFRATCFRHRTLPSPTRPKGARPLTVKLDVSRLRFGSTRDETKVKGEIITTDQWGYNVTVGNQTRRKGENLRADYVLYVSQATLKQGVQAKAAQIHRGGTWTIASIDLMGSVSFHTTSIPTKKIELQPGWSWSKTGNTDQVIDTLDGIWLRLYQGETMIAEFVSSDSLRKGGWPSDAPKPPSAQPGRRGAAAQ